MAKAQVGVRIASQPDVFSTKNLHRGHCLSRCCAAKDEKSLSASSTLPCSACHASHRTPVCHGSVRHTRQNDLLHNGHSSLRLSMSKANMNSHPAVGQQPMPSSASTHRCSAKRSYRATASGSLRQRATSAGDSDSPHLGSTDGQRSCSGITWPSVTLPVT